MTLLAPLIGTVGLADFAAGLEVDSLPPEVLHEARRALVDWLAVAFAGSQESGTEALLRAAAVAAPGTAGTIVGRRDRTSLPFAALINGFSAHVQDYDDTFNPGDTTVHGSAPVWPVIVALSEGRSVSGGDALAAFVAGFETETRVGIAAGPGHYDVGWHVTGTVGHVGAAAAAARLLGLSTERTTAALGIAATQAAGLKEVYGTDGKALHPGKAAMDGLLAGLFAQEGMSSSATALEGPKGLLAVMAPDPEPERLVEGLGTTWHLLANGYKAYPNGSLTHPTVDALLEVREQAGFRIEDVVEVVAGVHPYAATTTGRLRPESGLDAKFSLTHIAAVALAHGRPSLEHFTDTAVRNDDIVRRLRDLVRVDVDPTVSKQGAVVRVRCTDEREFTASVAHNKGTAANPLSDADLSAKLYDAAHRCLGDERTAALLSACWELSPTADFAKVVALAAPAPEAAR